MATKTLYRVVDVSGNQIYEDGARFPIPDDGPTPESIARAKEAQRRERQEVFERTGHLITDYQDGLHIVHCTRKDCGYVASARGEWRAFHALATHLVNVHLPVRVR